MEYFCLLQMMRNPSCLGRTPSHTKRCFTPALLLCTGIREQIENHRAKEGPRSLPVLSPINQVLRKHKVSLPKIKKKLIYMYFISIYLKRVIFCLVFPIFSSLFTWNQQGLNHLSLLMKAELLVDTHDSRRCCSLKSPEWWETLIISRELVTRAEDFE